MRQRLDRTITAQFQKYLGVRALIEPVQYRSSPILTPQPSSLRQDFNKQVDSREFAGTRELREGRHFRLGFGSHPGCVGLLVELRREATGVPGRLYQQQIHTSGSPARADSGSRIEPFSERIDAWVANAGFWRRTGLRLQARFTRSRDLDVHRISKDGA